MIYHELPRGTYGPEFSPAGPTEPLCMHVSVDGLAFLCSRAKGHSGSHAAHGHDDRLIAAWEAEA